MTFIESYFKTLSKTKFVTLLTVTFLLSLLSYEVVGNLYGYIYSESESYSEEMVSIFKTALVFQLPISLLFIVRMILVCFNKPRIVIVSQVFWLLNWLTIFTYFYITPEMSSREAHFPRFFLGMYNVFSGWLAAYMFFSPIKQISTLIFAYFYRK